MMDTKSDKPKSYGYMMYDNCGFCNVIEDRALLKEFHVTEGRYIVAFDPIGNESHVLRTPDDLLGFITAIERVEAWKPNIKEKTAHEPHLVFHCASSNVINTEPVDPSSTYQKDAINPSHYQGFVMDLQWLETMQYVYESRGIDLCAALELQVRKYLDRLGKKDDELQELKKSLWYLKFLIAFKINNCKPIRVRDIDKIIGG